MAVRPAIANGLASTLLAQTENVKALVASGEYEKAQTALLNSAAPLERLKAELARR